MTRHVLKTQGLAAGVHVAQSALDPEQVQIRIYESPGIQLTAGLQKEIEKYFTRQELRRSAFDEVGQTTYPTRVRESYVQDLDRLDRHLGRECAAASGSPSTSGTRRRRSSSRSSSGRSASTP